MRITLRELRQIIRGVLRGSSGSVVISEASTSRGNVATFNHNYVNWDLLAIDPDGSILAAMNDYIASDDFKKRISQLIRVRSFTVSPLTQSVDPRTNKVLYKCKVTTTPPKDFDRMMIVNHIDDYMMKALGEARTKQMKPVEDKKKTTSQKKTTARSVRKGSQESAICYAANDQEGTAVLYDVNILREILKENSVEDLTIDDISPAVLGCISAAAAGKECGGNWAVDFIKANKGVNGGILYRAGYAMSPNHTLMPDRDSVSPHAAAAWEKAFKKPEISKTPLPAGCEEPAEVGNKDFNPNTMAHLQYAYTMKDDSEFKGLVSTHDKFMAQLSRTEAERLEYLLLDNAGKIEHELQNAYFV